VLLTQCQPDMTSSSRLLLPRTFGRSGQSVSALGLGCSRLGSILGPGEIEASRLICYALERGINFFDTADIYGQGESERILGSLLHKSDAIIATKVGQRFSPAYRAMSMLKKPLAPLLRSSASGSRTLRVSRAKPLPLDFRSCYLNAAVEKSLRRLRRDALDVLFLHNPDRGDIDVVDAIDSIAELKGKGRIKLIGISTDSERVLLTALADQRVDAIQCRLPQSPEAREALSAASERGIAIIAREIFGGMTQSAAQSTTASLQSQVRSAVSNPFVTAALIGTTRPAHLGHAITSLKEPIGS
jgi:aryl-alcohol dehydrogenase-like predicted oxidoreductase